MELQLTYEEALSELQGIVKKLENKEVNIPIWLARNFLESTDVPRFKRILEEAILKKASEK